MTTPFREILRVKARVFEADQLVPAQDWAEMIRLSEEGDPCSFWMAEGKSGYDAREFAERQFWDYADEVAQIPLNDWKDARFNCRVVWFQVDVLAHPGASNHWDNTVLEAAIHTSGLLDVIGEDANAYLRSVDQTLSAANQGRRADKLPYDTVTIYPVYSITYSGDDWEGDYAFRLEGMLDFDFPAAS